MGFGLLNISICKLAHIRDDFTGFAIGIGILSWGSWDFNLGRNTLARGCLVAVGLLISSVARLLTLVTLNLLSVVRDWPACQFRGNLKVLIPALVSGIFLSLESVQCVQSVPT